VCLIYRTISLDHCELFVNFIGLMLRDNVFGGMRKEKKDILAAPYYKPRCSKPGEKVAAYSPELTVCFFVFFSFGQVLYIQSNLQTYNPTLSLCEALICITKFDLLVRTATLIV